ncbi:ribosome biogenesis regulatory protein, putative, partial [Eimeria acervulina]
LEEKTRQGAERFIHKLFSLERHSSTDGVYVQLPPAPKIDTLRFPRTLKLPTSRALTRWESFALAKGIKKRKRSALMWSEDKQDWVRRWGYKSIKHVQQQSQAVLEEKGAVLLRSRNISTKHAAAAAAAGGGGGRGAAAAAKKRRIAAADPAAAAAAAAAAAEGPGDLFMKAKQQQQLQKAKQKLREVRNAAEAQGGLKWQQHPQGSTISSAAKGAPRGAPRSSGRSRSRSSTTVLQQKQQHIKSSYAFFSPQELPIKSMQMNKPAAFAALAAAAKAAAAAAAAAA